MRPTISSRRVIGGVYRMDDDTVIRSGYGLAFESRPWAQNFRGHASYPLAINANFQPPAAASQFGWFGTLDQGLPPVTGPDTSSGRIPVPNTVGHNVTEPGCRSPAADTLMERGVRAPAAAGLRRHRVCRQQVRRRTSEHQCQPGADARRWQHRSPVLRLARAAARHQRFDPLCESGRSTRCRLASTVR